MVAAGRSRQLSLKFPTRANCEQESARKTIEQLVPKTFSEGFFADGVVLVEGDTDRVIVEVLAERLGSPLDLIGISVLDTGGKANLHLPYCLLSEFEVPCYVLVDGMGRALQGSTERTKAPY
jgi:putative ATP-dependent endonuclease of OLD family